MTTDWAAFFAAGRGGRGVEDKFFRVERGRSQNPRGPSGQRSNPTGSAHFQDGAGQGVAPCEQ